MVRGQLCNTMWLPLVARTIWKSLGVDIRRPRCGRSLNHWTLVFSVLHLTLKLKKTEIWSTYVCFLPTTHMVIWVLMEMFTGRVNETEPWRSIGWHEGKAMGRWGLWAAACETQRRGSPFCSLCPVLAFLPHSPHHPRVWSLPHMCTSEASHCMLRS